MEEKRPIPDNKAGADEVKPPSESPPSYSEASADELKPPSEPPPSYDHAVVDVKSVEPRPYEERDIDEDEIVKPPTQDSGEVVEHTMSEEELSPPKEPPPGDLPTEPEGPPPVYKETEELSVYDAKPPAGAAPEATDTFTTPTIPEEKEHPSVVDTSYATSTAFEESTEQRSYSKAGQRSSTFHGGGYGFFVAVAFVVSPYSMFMVPLFVTTDLMYALQLQRDAQESLSANSKTLNDLKDQLKDLKVALTTNDKSPQDYLKEVEKIKTQLEAIKDNGTLTEKHRATELLKRVERYNTLGKAEEAKQEREKSKAMDAPKKEQEKTKEDDTSSTFRMRG